MLPPDAIAPQLCFGLVRHARLRPARNAFSYGGYYLRLPLRTLGDGGFKTALCSRNRFNLLSFHDADHGDGQQPLLAWIDGFLRAEGVTDADGEIWLQAMPRVLGFVFNPVSFWFCHGRDGALRAIVCDVRNTFGERHRYLLGGGGVIRNGALLTARKVFHVSPFCAVEGSYRFRFTCALRLRAGDPAEQTLACIDYHDNAGLLLQTSVSGRAAPLSTASAARAFFFYPLMTFNVVVRIHLQALRLWCKRVPFFSKPAPPKQKVSR
jgi:DUF1365 family protein